MTLLPVAAPVITAWEAYSPLGHGAQAHAEGLRAVGRCAPAGPAVRDFDVRETLGRTGTRSMDRAAGLAVTTTRRLLERVGTAEAPLTGYHADEIIDEDAWYAEGVGQVKYDGGQYIKELKKYSHGS